MMSNKNIKVLQITTYPVDNPDHGGKLRCFNIRKALRKQFEVETLSFDVQQFESINGLSVTLAHDKFVGIVKSHLFFDWGINLYLNESLSLKSSIFTAVKDFSPDIIIIEQGFLWPLVLEMKKKNIINKDTSFVYSAHNIEYQMKKQIYASLFSGKELQKYVSIVQSIEYDVIKNADVIWAVSEYDINYIRQVSFTDKIYLYINGHCGLVKTTLANKWKEKFEESKRNWVYVASWHGPNINGLYDLVTNGLLEKDSSDTTLWVFGSVGAGLLNERHITIPKNASIQIVGPSSEEDIDSAISVCTGIVLPIWEGGGSNLKTAQALLSGKKIVASNFAFRGFESYKNENELYLDDKPDQLVKHISELEHTDETIHRNKSINGLKWENIFSTLTQTITSSRGNK